MEKMFRMADGTILTTSNEVVIKQYESRPEVYTSVTEADLKAEPKSKKNKVEEEAPVEEPVEPETKTEGK